MAIEIANIIHAIGLVDSSQPLAPALLAGDGFSPTITRVGAGVYRLTTLLSLDFGEALPFASVPAYGANTPTVNAAVVADGVIEIVIAEDGVPLDPPFFLACVMRYRSGQIPIPPLPPVVPGGGTLELFVDPAAGNDANPGTQALPIKTLDEVDRRIPNVTGNVNVHLRNASYELPLSGTWLSPRTYRGLVNVFGDPVWDPTVLNVTFTGAAAALTNNSSIVIPGAPIADHSLVGTTIEVTHAGTVQRKTVLDNVANAVIPCDVFTVGAAPGDAVRLYTSNAILTPPVAGPGTFAIYTVMADQVSDTRDIAAGSFIADSSLSTPIVGLALQNITTVSTAGYQFLGFGRGLVFLYGVNTVDAGSGFTLNFYGTEVYSGQGLGLTQSNDQGWGLGVTGDTFNTGPQVSGGSFSGVFASVGGFFFAIAYATLQVFGGRCTRLVGLGASFIQTNGATASIPFLIDARGTPAAAVTSFIAACQLELAGFTELQGGGGGIQLSDGALATLSASVTGGTAAGAAADIETGSQLIVAGATPAFGGAAVYKTTNTVGVAAAALVAGFALVDPTDTSAIIVGT